MAPGHARRARQRVVDSVSTY
ncbi:hypothetical protein BN1263200021 [Stenotrophomonas maltophilia]|nr:hypothetical protein BN1263200021 [Stenotrophomonas maltophilia]